MDSSTAGAAAGTDAGTSLAAGAAVGTTAGGAAYLLGYLITYVTQGDRIEAGLSGINVFADLFGGDPVSVWRAAGWVFYNAHFVDLSVPSLIGAAQSVNLVSQAAGGLLGVLFVVPPVLLAIAGAVAGRTAEAATPADGARSGALVAAGYLPLAVIGAFLFRYPVGDGSVAPDLVTAVLLAGVVYPVAFGAVGGAVAGVVEN